jgi:CheY-like chemotaxis protein
MNENSEKNEFLSSVSREVRTALNTIVGLSEDISEYQDVPDEIREDAEDIKTASKSLFELIDNVFDYSLIETGKMKISNAPYKPKDLFEKIAKIDEERFEDKPIDFHANIDSNLPYELVGDKKHIEKIVNNLLFNAIKYTDGGDIWLDVSCINDNDYCSLIISVKDTGRGMTEEELDKLFTRIKGLNVEKEDANKGLGLGLAISKNLIDLMGGSINVSSTYGEGSTFEVTINQKISQLEESDLSRTQRLRLQEINYDNEGYGYKKILIVDDNALNIKVVRRILEQFDLILDECYDGQECVDIVTENNDYDLILMDIMMPGMSGEETLNKLKEIEGFKTPVIALTADAEIGSEEKYESEGFADYIAKPFTKMEIEQKMDKIFKEEDILEEKKAIKIIENPDEDLWDDEY